MPCIAVSSPTVDPNTTSPSSTTTATGLSSLSPPPWMDLLNFQETNSTSVNTSFSTTGLKSLKPDMRIQIPVMSTTTSLLLSPTQRGRGKKSVDEIEGEGDVFAAYCKRGWRYELEDRFTASVHINGNSKQGFFGVFDGHGGANAAEFAAVNLEKNVMKRVEGKLSSVNACDIEEAVRDGYLETDSEYMKENDGGGCCCVTAVITKGNLVVSNAGDCRAVLSRGGVAEALTVDHRPSREDERERVESTGGYVDSCNGVWRIQSTLAVSRSIGDHHLKQWVTAEPETTALRIKPDCQFLIMASDGVWDKVTNQEAVDTVLPLWVTGNGEVKPNPGRACRELVELSVKRGSYDDASAMVVMLDHFVE